jgi:N-dimethylarginine dimethylaminohydrolase
MNLTNQDLAIPRQLCIHHSLNTHSCNRVKTTATLKESLDTYGFELVEFNSSDYTIKKGSLVATIIVD